jgi:hypothetical protein
MFWAPDLQEIRAMLGASCSPGRADEGYIAAEAAAARYGFQDYELHAWHAISCTYLAGQKLRTRTAASGPANKLLYNVEDLDKIHRARQTTLKAPYVDAEGTWLQQATATKRYGLVEQLSHWRKRPSRFLGSRKIRAKKVPRPGKRNRWREVWVYHEDDLRAIAAARADRNVNGTAGAGVLFGEAREAQSKCPLVGDRVLPVNVTTHADFRSAPPKEVEPGDDDYMPAKEAAEFLGIMLPQLVQLCNRNELKSRKPNKAQKVGREHRQVLKKDVFNLNYKRFRVSLSADGTEGEDLEGIQERYQRERQGKQIERGNDRPEGR